MTDYQRILSVTFWWANLADFYNIKISLGVPIGFENTRFNIANKHAKSSTDLINDLIDWRRVGLYEI